MIRDLYVVGGKQGTARPLTAGNGNWNGYDEGVIVRIKADTQDWEECVSYVSPPEVCSPGEAAITFQAGAIQNNRLYTCTQTEVLVFDLPTFQRIGYLSLPFFNDLHHVRPTPTGDLLIANAGLEMVIHATASGEICKVWNVLGEDPWQLNSETDYRKISTKPHHSHPNYLFYIGSEPWATRFHQGDAICLTQPEKRIEVSKERIHDGVVHEGKVYFSSVNGCIYIADTETLTVERTINLSDMHPEGTLLGWCRSLYVEADKLWVGFSRIRPTKWRENVTWLVRGFKYVQPTHIACYDLTKMECVEEINLEPMGLNAVYSIFSAGA
jgi:hypothetical protein